MSTVHTTGEPTAIGSSDQVLEAGHVVGEYVVADLLGKGGFGTVYRAVHPLIGKQVAIKVLARKYSSDDAIVSRFVAEARAVNQIRHRNIIDIFSFGQLADGRHYYVMELLEGEPLDKLLAGGPLTVEQALPILRAIAKALDAAHAKGIAHRDLKPENIFLAQDSEGERYPKLLDFGIAKLLAPEEQVKHRTATGAPIGTPYYMSPEQCRGRDVDHRTDIYSFGIVAYRMLTGAYPFDSQEYLELMMQQINDEAPPPSSKNPTLPPVIDAAIAAMMRKDPAERPRSCAAAIAAMTDGGAITPALTPALPRMSGRASSVSALGATQVSESALPLPAEAPVRGRGRGAGWVAAAAVVVLGGGVAAFLATRSPPTTPAASPPQPPAPIVAPPPADAAAPPAVAVDAPVAPAPSKYILLTIEGAPAGTEVKLAGSTVGVTPTVQLERGAGANVLTLVADGFTPVALTITPDRDQTAKVTLKKKARATGIHRPPGGADDPDGIPDPFKRRP